MQFIIFTAKQAQITNMTYEESREIDKLLESQYPQPKSIIREFIKRAYQKGVLGMWIKDKEEREEEELNKFHKVSIEQFLKDFLKQFPLEAIGDTAMVEEVYEMIKLPKRSTSGSAGYDFFAPVGIKLEPYESIIIPTGIKCQIDTRWFLGIFPRSGLGFKYELKLANTCAVIDQDYYDNKDNEGHIMIKLVNGNKPLEIEEGKAFVQAIFLPYGITVDDETDGVREGGIGSTDRRGE